MEIDVLIVSSISLDRKGFLENLCRALEARDQKPAVLTASYQSERLLKKAGITCFNLEFIAAQLPSSSETFASQCGLYERRYELPSLRYFCSPEHSYFQGSEKSLQEKALRYFRALEGLFSRHAIACLVQKQGGELIRRVAYQVARRFGIPALYLGESFIENRMLIYEDEEGHITLPLRRADDQSEYEDAEWLEPFLGQFRKQKRVFKYSFAVPSRLQQCKELLEAIYEGDSSAAWHSLRQRVYRSLWMPCLRLLARQYVQNVPTSEPYFFFPLHISDDTQITIRNPQFYEQEWLVRYIARVLPQGYRLVVKGHPGAAYNYQQLKCLTGQSNVIVVNPEANAHDIIRHAAGVITINSTVGLEALCYFKPVIVVGSWFLRGYGATVDVTNLAELPRAIHRAIDAPVDVNRIKKVLLALRRATYKGSVYSPQINYAGVAGAIITKVRHSGVRSDQRTSEPYARARVGCGLRQ